MDKENKVENMNGAECRSVKKLNWYLPLALICPLVTIGKLYHVAGWSAASAYALCALSSLATVLSTVVNSMIVYEQLAKLPASFFTAADLTYRNFRSALPKFVAHSWYSWYWWWCGFGPWSRAFSAYKSFKDMEEAGVSQWLIKTSLALDAAFFLQVAVALVLIVKVYITASASPRVEKRKHSHPPLFMLLSPPFYEAIHGVKRWRCANMEIFSMAITVHLFSSTIINYVPYFCLARARGFPESDEVLIAFVFFASMAIMSYAGSVWRAHREIKDLRAFESRAEAGDV